MLRRYLVTATLLTVVTAVALGLIYPLVVYGVGQAVFKSKADGSFVTRNGQIIGSPLIGQAFLNKKGDPARNYFQPRPSAVAYNAGGSGASNLGPSDPRLIDKCLPVQATDKAGNPKVDKKGNPVYEKNPDGSNVCDSNTVPQRAIAYRQFNGIPAKVDVPVDAVTASASGLDPDISPANAQLQAPRVAKVRGLPLAAVRKLVDDHTNGRAWGFLGEKTVNVFDLNLALDKLKS
jgi:K+-transporting ATPase ATPase C chain